MIALREEVKEVTSEFGWTKDAVDSMYKIDSFVRESLRFNGIATRKSTGQSCSHELTLFMIVHMQRTVMKPEGMTFSNGITLPQGTLISVPERVIHDDNGTPICQRQIKRRWNADILL